MAPSPNQRPTWAEIDLDNLAENFRSVRDFIGPQIPCMAVIKADAYGHGAIECGQRLEREGAEWFAVATVEEALEMRQNGIVKPILVLGGFWPGQIAAGIENKLTPVVFTLEQAAAINRAAKERSSQLTVHVKLDTGMGRIGFRSDDAAEIAAALAGLNNLKIEGLMTHFAAADDLGSDFTANQIARFDQAVRVFRAVGIEPEYVDMANSPGAVAYPDSRSNLVRLGGVLYGLGGDVLPKGIETPALKPVMSLHSRIAMIKHIRRGESVGYSRTFTAARDSLIATIPVGYHDGLRRGLSNLGKVIIRGHFAPIVGRISMDWTTVDVTEIEGTSAGDRVTLIGKEGTAEIRAEDIAAELGTISYEVTCGISRRVPRVFVGSR